MARILIGASLLLLSLSAVFGFLNNSKVRNLRVQQANAIAAQDAAERARVAQEKEAKARETAMQAKLAENDSRVANAEAELIKTQTERADLQAKLQTNEAEIVELRARLDAVGPIATGPEGVPGPTAVELQTQLEETRRQLDNAEREKMVLSEQIQAVQERAAKAEQQKKQLAANRPGLRGTILAVNDAYNFVVLNLGGRQGIERNSEMLVLRGGNLIGKIRVSSVEPATAIGDIISGSLARGVQVQPGDTVVYAGNNS